MDPALSVAQAVVWMMNGAVFPAMTMASSQLLHNIKEETATSMAARAAGAGSSSNNSGALPPQGQPPSFLEDKDIQNVIEDILKKHGNGPVDLANVTVPQSSGNNAATVTSTSTSTAPTPNRKSRPRLAQYGDYDKIPRQHKCPDCPYQTDNSSHLKRHKNSVHSCIKLYQCYVCFKEYSRLEKLKNHFLKSHPTDVYNSALAKKDQNDLNQQMQAGMLSQSVNQEHPVGQVAGIALAVASQSNSMPSAVFATGNLNSQIALQPAKSHTQERRYKCDSCSYMGKDSWHLKRHITDVHEVTKLFKCPKCGYGTSRKHRMVSHMKGHGMLACLYCPFETINLPEYTDHLQFCGKIHRGQTVTSKPETFECSICLLNFMSMPTLTSHLLGAHGLKGAGSDEVSAVSDILANKDNNLANNPQEAQPGKRKEDSALPTKFKYPKLTTQNMQNLNILRPGEFQQQPVNFAAPVAMPTMPNLTQKPKKSPNRSGSQSSAGNKNEGLVARHKCPHCNFIAKDNWYLRRHMNDVHIKLKSFSCPFCKYCSSRRERLTKHLKQHGELSCPHCELKLADRTDFLNHMKACSTTSTPCKEQQMCCDVCPEKLDTFEEFQAHNLECHNSKIDKCPLCPFSTSDIKALEIHKQTHKTNNPTQSSGTNSTVSGNAYFCTECKSSFASSEALQSHVRENHQALHVGPQPEIQSAILPTSHSQPSGSSDSSSQTRPQSVQPPAELAQVQRIQTPMINQQIPARPHSVPVEPRSTINAQHLIAVPQTVPLLNLQSIAAVTQNAAPLAVVNQTMQPVSNAQSTSQPQASPGQAHMTTAQLHPSQTQPHPTMPTQMGHQVAFQMAPQTAYNINPAGVNVGHHAAHTLVSHQPTIMGHQVPIAGQQASHLGQHRLGFLPFNPYAFQTVDRFAFSGHVHYPQTENGPK